MATQAEKKQAKLLAALADGPKTPAALVKELGWKAEDLKAVGQALMKENLIEAGPAGTRTLQLVEKKKKAAPAKKSAPVPPAKKAKVVEPDEDDEDEEEDEDDWDEEDEEDDEDVPEEEDDEEEDEDEDDDPDDEEDDDEEDDEDGDDEEDDDEEDEEDDDDDDDEDDLPPPVKKGRGKTPAPAKAPAKKRVEKAKVEFSMQFKPIDTLTDDELQRRLDVALEVAESNVEDYYELSEMLMRSAVRVRKQIEKRAA